MEEEALIRAIRQRIEVGAPVDLVLGRPGEELDDAQVVVQEPDGAERRVYEWGTPECRTALENGLIDPPALPAPATPDQVARVEEVVGAALPPLLSRLLTEVADGGFGPGHGLLGVGRADEWQGMPDGLIPVCDWGDGVTSYVDGDGRMWGQDPNPVDPGEPAPVFREDHTLASWLEEWIAGELIQPITVGGDHGWRGATAEEKRGLLADEG